jgi:hypothetical protein
MNRNETLSALFPPVNAVYDGAGSYWADVNGYRRLDDDALLFTATIDLFGWSMEEYTFGTMRTQYQDPGVYTSDAVSSRTEVMEIISDVPISLTNLITIKSNMGITAPGLLQSNEDFTTIIYGNYRLYVPNASLAAFPGFLQLISSGSFGSKEPTASAELFCYRILKCTGAPLETLTAPACRVGLFGTFYLEADLEYIMRLKRSYELQELGV